MSPAAFRTNRPIVSRRPEAENELEKGEPLFRKAYGSAASEILLGIDGRLSLAQLEMKLRGGDVAGLA